MCCSLSYIKNVIQVIIQSLLDKHNLFSLFVDRNKLNNFSSKESGNWKKTTIYELKGQTVIFSLNGKIVHFMTHYFC